MNNNLTKQQRKEKLWRNLAITISIILALVFLLFLPLEAAYMQEPEYVILESKHNIGQYGYCEIHALVIHATDKETKDMISGITALHKSKYNDPSKYRAKIYVYRDIFDYLSENPLELYHQYSDSNFTQKYPN